MFLSVFRKKKEGSWSERRESIKKILPGWGGKRRKLLASISMTNGGGGGASDDYSLFLTVRDSLKGGPPAHQKKLLYSSTRYVLRMGNFPGRIRQWPRRRTEKIPDGFSLRSVSTPTCARRSEGGGRIRRGSGREEEKKKSEGSEEVRFYGGYLFGDLPKVLHNLREVGPVARILLPASLQQLLQLRMGALRNGRPQTLEITGKS